MVDVLVYAWDLQDGCCLVSSTHYTPTCLPEKVIPHPFHTLLYFTQHICKQESVGSITRTDPSE